mmetsp:Transcript_33868/g.71215  ORF Transcript_33868/g.71215 Transcript_33868/m.71215 type:complete len:238 (+) Transcript_33868:196-909(+)
MLCPSSSYSGGEEEGAWWWLEGSTNLSQLHRRKKHRPRRRRHLPQIGQVHLLAQIRPFHQIRTRRKVRQGHPIRSLRQTPLRRRRILLPSSLRADRPKENDRGVQNHSRRLSRMRRRGRNFRRRKERRSEKSFLVARSTIASEPLLVPSSKKQPCQSSQLQRIRRLVGGSIHQTQKTNPRQESQNLRRTRTRGTIFRIRQRRSRTERGGHHQVRGRQFVGGCVERGVSGAWEDEEGE